MDKAAKNAIDCLRRAARKAMAEQIAVAEIPSPSWKAGSRGEHLIGRFADLGVKAHSDAVGNVVAVIEGTRRDSYPAAILSAHMDSVFYDIKDIKVERKGSRYYAPGICDNAVGVATLIMIAGALRECGAKTPGDVVLVGSVGEEGEGRLRGMRHFWKDCPYHDPWFISIDGSGASVAHKALASWSPTIVVKGPGGHSYSNHGRPNPVHMLSRFVARLTDTLEADAETNTVFSATVMQGGTALNVIPSEVRLVLNLRSADTARLDQMVRTTRRLLRDARREELDRATGEGDLQVRHRAVARPGGHTSTDHPLVQTAFSAYRAEGLAVKEPVISTDANMPMSLGVPAINVGAGGRAANVHSVHEWYENSNRGSALAAIGRMVFQTTGWKDG